MIKRRKNADDFICNKCNFKCSKNSDWCRHLTTAKHKKIINEWLNGVSIMKHGAIKISNNIRNYLFEINDSKCQNCGWSEINEYTGKTPLEVDHIDGDSQNNSFNNLRLLCPNCHSLTKTWKNIGSRKSTRVTRNKPSSHSG